MAKPQCRIGSDGALTIDDSSDSIHWHVDMPRQFGGGIAEFPPLFFSFCRKEARSPAALIAIINRDHGNFC
jgi:hypothetical protein